MQEAVQMSVEADSEHIRSHLANLPRNLDRKVLEALQVLMHIYNLRHVMATQNNDLE